MTRRIALLLAACALALPAQVFAGFLFVDERGAQMFLSKGRIKHVSSSGEEPVVAVDSTRGRLWVSNPRAKAYWEGTVEEFCTAVKALTGGAAGAAMSPEMDKLMKEKLAGLPPDQQEMVKQMMARSGQAQQAAPEPPPRVTVEAAGDGENVAGLATKKFRVLADGKLYEEVWLTSDPAITREFDMGKAPEIIAKFSACQARGASRVQETDAYRQLFAKGWPLKTVAHGGGFSRPHVVKAERRDIGDAEFAPPSGYKKLAALMEVFATR